MSTPESLTPVGEFLAVMRRLRAECPWKQEQTHRSLVRYLLEESAEVVDAIDAGEASGDWSHLAEELGDVLLQVVFHAVIAEERGDFGLDDVARGITAKMRRRNPHVFGPEAPDGGAGGDDGGHRAPLDADAVNDLWQQTKAREKGASADAPRPVTEGIPSGLSALLYADKVIDRLERAGRPVVTDPAADAVGERLLALVAEARAAGVDPEEALRDAVRSRIG